MSQQQSSTGLTHLDQQGRASMVDVGWKDVTRREAVARGFVTMKPETLARIQQGAMEKGDVFAVARVAAIQAGKETSRWIPLCHPLPLDALDVDFVVVGEDVIEARAAAATIARTGVEMEAIVAVTAALVTIYDMGKSADRGMEIFGVHLLEKEGGRSGKWEWGKREDS